MRISKRPEERRQEIIEVAQKHFEKKGYEATQIKDIVNEMGVAQGLFYYYFKSKDEVFEAVAEAYATVVVKKISTRIEQEKMALNQLYGIVDGFAEVANDNRLLFEQLHKAQDGVFLNKIIEMLRYLLIPKVTEIVANGVESRELDCEYIDEVSAIISLGIFQFLEVYYRDVEEKDIEKITNICKMVIQRNFVKQA